MHQQWQPQKKPGMLLPCHLLQILRASPHPRSGGECAFFLSPMSQNAVIKTGQVYGFYADVRKLGIEKYGPRPPRALTASLGREIEKYDQLCDAMESHLLRAITVLQRDLSREEKRIKAEAEAAMAIIPKPPSPATSAHDTTGFPITIFHNH
ncbi:hypothetical protein A0H81_00304 [Grifola frondosa]|uniref:Uncharacterized protein n=1 Tax=Grifola frondosa TaxID=5627 RepID=A0A1C7MQ74_GRIFR|nr:hypothetical protein A0H81_00304 [Grifola frondosa]